MARRVARKACALTGAYDSAIAEWMGRDEPPSLPDTWVLTGHLAGWLRYGENPHQSAAFYRASDVRLGIATARQLQGKELSYNNYSDADAAFELVAEFRPPAVAIVKHANPCGAAVAGSLPGAWAKALAWGPASSVGGLVRRHPQLGA